MSNIFRPITKISNNPLILPFKDIESLKISIMEWDTFDDDISRNKLDEVTSKELKYQLHKIFCWAEERYGRKSLSIFNHINRLIYGKIKVNKLCQRTRVSLFNTETVLSRKKSDIVSYIINNSREPFAFLAVVRLNWQFITPSSPWVLLEWWFGANITSKEKGIVGYSLKEVWWTKNEGWGSFECLYIDAKEAIAHGIILKSI